MEPSRRSLWLRLALDALLILGGCSLALRYGWFAGLPPVFIGMYGVQEAIRTMRAR